MFQLRRRFRRTHPSSPPAKSSPVKIIGLEGPIAVYDRKIKAAELMKEHDCHLVCRSDSFFIGQKVPALSAMDELQPGQSYFLLPAQFFQSVLSFVTVASSIAKAGGGSLRHFDIQKTDAGKLQVRICDDFEEKKEEKEGRRRCGVLCSDKEMAKEYERIVGSSYRPWTPKLESIDESLERRRRRIRVFCGMRAKNYGAFLT